MERIFLSRIVALLIFCLSCGVCLGQSNYYVFKKRGKPVLNTDKVLERGGLFSVSDTLFIGNQDYVLLVNEVGELFEFDKPNRYAFSSIVDFQRKLESDSFTKKYFSYVWRQFTNQTKRKQEAGVVYREERNVKMVSPIDSSRIYAPEVRFSWQNNTDIAEVFFFLRDLKTNHLTKIGLYGNSMLLSLDNNLLKSGQSYEWAMATTKFPNLNELKFNNLNLLSKEEFEKLNKEMEAIIKAFTLLGFSKEEVQEAICLDYKFCFY